MFIVLSLVPLNNVRKRQHYKFWFGSIDNIEARGQQLILALVCANHWYLLSVVELVPRTTGSITRNWIASTINLSLNFYYCKINLEVWTVFGGADILESNYNYLSMFPDDHINYAKYDTRSLPQDVSISRVLTR